MKLSTNPVTVTYEISWNRTDWSSKQKLEDITINDLTDNLAQYSQDVEDALDATCAFYYSEDKNHRPSEHGVKEMLKQLNFDGQLDISKFIHNGHLPWAVHKQAAETFSGSHADKYQKLLGEILKSPWFTTWHWKAILPAIKYWNAGEDKEKHVIQISHLRKWEMLLCYSTQGLGQIGLDKPRPTLADVKSLDLKQKNLLRAPLFGVSNRLKRWDAYRLFYIQENLEEIKNLNNGRLSLKEKADILGRHDVYFIIEKVETSNDGKSYTIKAQVILDLDPGNKHLKLSGLDNEISVTFPETLIDIPAFHDNNGAKQLLASDVYCEAIAELTEVLNDPTAKSLLLIAPPGSGKEMLSEMAFTCREKLSSDENRKGKFISTTLAGLSPDQAANILFNVSEITLKDLKAEPKRNIVPEDDDGLVIQALSGALFVDEIDKATPDVRSMLLRFLESGEFTVPATNATVKLDSDDIPFYIFSGSYSRMDMFGLHPPDFWTRISHVIEVAHPLRHDEISTAKMITKDYIHMFWLIHVKSFIDKKNFHGPVKNEKSSIALVKPLQPYFGALYAFLLSSATCDFVSRVLTNTIVGKGKATPSVRTLRSIVGRSLFRFLEKIMYAKSEDEPLETIKVDRAMKEKVDNAEMWFKEIEDLLKIDSAISSGASGADTPVNLKSFELRFLDDLKQSIILSASLVN